MISRFWHGWTSHDDADANEELLKSEIFPGIIATVPGFERIDMMRKDNSENVEFIAIMWFAELNAVKAFAGEDCETPYVPPAARQVLDRFDARSKHYEVRLTPSGKA